MNNMYEFIIKFDCDFIISEKLITGLVQTFDRNKNAVAVSPKVYYHINEKTKIIWWKGVNLQKIILDFREQAKVQVEKYWMKVI